MRKSSDVTELLDQEPERPRSKAASRGKGCLAVLVALAIIVAGGWFVWDRGSNFIDSLTDVPDYTDPQGTQDITINVAAGATLTSIGGQLVDKDVIKSTKAFDRAIDDTEKAVTVQAGDYLMRTQLPAAVALERLTSPGKYRVSTQVQVIEGLRLSQQVKALAKGTEISAKEYRQALQSPGELGLPRWAKNRPEGFLFPDTYEVTGQDTATTMLQQMTGQFTAVSGEIGLPQRAKAMKLNPYQVVTVASIVEAEVRRPQDRAKVARVIYNRLDRGMKLQMDSTVHYAVNKSDKVTTTPRDRRSRSPYNTYRHQGLPPGPISAPGQSALQAAAKPARGNWLYFVTVNPDTGETKFANNAAGHQKNVRQFQRWCQTHQGRC